MKHYIEMSEIRSRVFVVDAETLEDALEAVQDAYDGNLINMNDVSIEGAQFWSIVNKDTIDDLVKRGRAYELPKMPSDEELLGKKEKHNDNTNSIAKSV